MTELLVASNDPVIAAPGWRGTEPVVAVGPVSARYVEQFASRLSTKASLTTSVNTVEEPSRRQGSTRVESHRAGVTPLQ